MRVHDPKAYRKMNVTRERIRCILEWLEILLPFQTGLKLVNAAIVYAILECISGLESSSVITEPRYLKLVIVSSYCTAKCQRISKPLSLHQHVYHRYPQNLKKKTSHSFTRHITLIQLRHKIKCILLPLFDPDSPSLSTLCVSLSLSLSHSLFLCFSFCLISLFVLLSLVIASIASAPHG